MKKILLTVAENKFPEGAFEFIRQLNDINPVLVTGVFLREVEYSLEPAFGYYGGLGVPVYSPETETVSREEIRKRIEWFESSCKKNSIEYRVHNDTDDLIIHELKKETRFADLLVVSAEAFYQLSESAEPEGYLKSILHLAECPVLIVPHTFNFPDHIVMAYDGTELSVYAIKQFAYLFPEFCNKEVIVAYDGKGDEKNLPDEILIHELAARHFNKLTFVKLNKNMFGLSSWINLQKKSMFVSGSYGRSDFSELFRKSFVTDIIRGHKLPLFIAHR